MKLRVGLLPTTVARAVGCALVACGCWPAPRAQADSTMRPAAQSPPGALILEDTPQPLTPRHTPDPAQADRLEAKKVFAAARLLERHEDYPAALRAYQRAFRLDPDSVAILQEIVGLAFRLKRSEMAMRYALKAADVSEGEIMLPLMLKLGAFLAEQGELERAAAIYQRVRTAIARQAAAPADQRPDVVPRVVLDLELGRLYHVLGQHAKAAALFADVIDAQDHPDKYDLDKATQDALRKDTAVNFRVFGESFLRTGKYDQAAQAFRRAQAAKADAAEDRYQQAQIKAKTGRPQEALDDLQAYFASHASGEGVGPYELLADVLKELRKEPELLPRLEQLRKDDPQNVPLGFFLAQRYRQADQLAQAEPLYRAVAAKKNGAGAYPGLVNVQRRLRHVDDLLATIGEMVKQGASLAPLAAETDAILDDASLMNALIDAVRRQHAADAAQPPFGARLAVALLALQDKRYAAAEELFLLAIEAQPKQAAELLMVWGGALLADDRPADAVGVFQRAAQYKLNSASEAALAFYLAGALELDNRTDAALAAARKAARLRKDSARMSGREAWVLFHARRYADARKAYQALLERFDGNYRSEENRRALREARLVLSNIETIENRLDAAEPWLEEVLDEYPDDVSALNDLGYLWADRGVHLHRALRMLQQAVQEEPDNTAFRDSLGWVYFRLKKYPEAIAELEKAAAKAEKNDGVIFEHLGDAYAAQGQADKARGAWQKALELLRQEKDQDAQKIQRVTEKLKRKPTR